MKVFDCNSSRSESQIHLAISGLAEHLGLTDIDLAEMMKTSCYEVNRLRHDFSLLPVSSVYNLSDYFDLDFESFVNNKYDIKTLKAQRSGEDFTFINKYNKFRKSKMRTITNVLDILESSNPYFVKKVTNKFQLSPSMLADGDLAVSGVILQDLFIEMKNENYPLSVFSGIGRRNCLKYQNSLMKDFSGKLTSQRVYEYAIQSIESNVEKNLSYTIKKLSGNSLVLDVQTREETQCSLKVEHFGTQLHRENIRGWFEAINLYGDRAMAKVKQLSSVFQGDESCQFEISFPCLH